MWQLNLGLPNRFFLSLSLFLPNHVMNFYAVRKMPLSSTTSSWHDFIFCVHTTILTGLWQRVSKTVCCLSSHGIYKISFVIWFTSKHDFASTKFSIFSVRPLSFNYIMRNVNQMVVNYFHLKSRTLSCYKNEPNLIYPKDIFSTELSSSVN